MIFLDTGAFLGWYKKSDQYHKQARSVWLTLEAEKRPLYTSNFVLDETLTLLGRRTSYPFAAEQGEALYTSSLLTILRPSVTDELASLELFEKYADQEMSFTDCVSFTLMRRVGLTRVFTFDKHFRWAGFEVTPA
jgi:predicted nucleic acid-binding protein